MHEFARIWLVVKFHELHLRKADYDLLSSCKVFFDLVGVKHFKIIFLQGFGNLAGIGKLLRFFLVLFSIVVLAQMGMESPEQKK